MATRMQQRRATAAQWTSVNPTLAPGEIGFETDTSKFKIGNGVNAWDALDYFTAGTDLTGYATESYVDTAVSNIVDSAPGVLDTLNELAAAIGDDANFVTTINTTITDGDAATLASAQSYADTQDAATLAAANTYADTEIANLVDSSPAALDTLNELAAALGDDPNFATTVTNQIAGKADASHTHAISDVAGLQAELDAKEPLRRQFFSPDGGNLFAEYDNAIIGNWNGSNISVPANTFAQGSRIDFVQTESTAITFSPGSGMTIHSKDGMLQTAGQYSGATLVFRSPTVAYLIGDLA